jgi:hypothetical protein
MARALTEIPDVEPRNIAARVLAPLALVACGLALFLLVSGALSGGSDDPATSERERPRTERNRPAPEIEGDAYVVQAGDTFSGIAAKAGIPQARLERLNPDVDTATLNAGQVLELP